jgi:bifunctional DNA-binding transcriptional regulator/antitoxin component of YhaV-PrlF toxin-antitoxin module
MEMGESFTCKPDNQGRILLPVEWRKRHGVDSSSELLLSEDDSGDLRVETRSQAVRRAQALVREYIPPGMPLVDEFVQERLREAQDEYGE